MFSPEVEGSFITCILGNENLLGSDRMLPQGRSRSLRDSVLLSALKEAVHPLQEVIA